MTIYSFKILNMYRECFLYSQEKISSKPTPNMIYLHSNDSKIYISKQIPYFAYFKIPIHLQNKWTFYANDIQINVKINDLVSVPFFKLQNLIDISKKQETCILNKEISHILNKSLDVWFHNNDKCLEEDDIIIFLKIISTNFSFNHFSSIYKKMHPDKSKDACDLSDMENQIEITFKKFLLSVRPNGKPSSRPLFELSTSFLMFFHQLKYSEFYITHQKFVSYGIHYILDYLHKDNEWGPYAILSFISRQLKINQIKSYPLNNYIIDQNPEFFFDKKNLKCVEECATIFGKISLLWCYNPCFHNNFVEISKNSFGKRGRRIKRAELFDVILSRICNESEDEFSNVSVNDYSSFYNFIQIVSPETDNKQIFSEIYSMFFSNNSDESKLIPFKFKLFYESEIKCQMNKRSAKLYWLDLLEEQNQLDQNSIDFNIDDSATNKNSPFIIINNENNDFEAQNERFFDYSDSGHFCSTDFQNSTVNNKPSIYSNKSLNFHHIIFSGKLPINSEKILKTPIDDDDQPLENLDEWPLMKERFGKIEVKLIKKPENDLNISEIPFNFIQSSTIDSILDDNQNKTQININNSNNSISNEAQNHEKEQNGSKQHQNPINNREKSFSII